MSTGEKGEFRIENDPKSPDGNGNRGQDLGKIRAKTKNPTWRDSFGKQTLTGRFGEEWIGVAAFTPMSVQWPRTSRAVGGGRSPGRGRQVPPGRWRWPPRSRRSRLPGRGARPPAARSRSDR